MSKIEIKHPDKKISTGAYSAGVLIEGWLYVSGQGPVDLATGKVVEGSIEDQTRLTLSHVGKVLKAGGCSFDDVVKCTCHLADINDFDAFNRVYAEFFTGVRPARTTVQSVLWGGIKIEIDAVARAKG
jgi:2-iminobutanoate/2-iminopropanoate deaminase